MGVYIQTVCESNYKLAFSGQAKKLKTCALYHRAQHKGFPSIHKLLRYGRPTRNSSSEKLEIILQETSSPSSNFKFSIPCKVVRALFLKTSLTIWQETCMIEQNWYMDPQLRPIERRVLKSKNVLRTSLQIICFHHIQVL